MSIINIDELIKLSQFLVENDYHKKNITVNFGIKTRELLNRINEDIYYRNTEKKETLKDVDEIILNINGITFKYVLDENGFE